MTQITSISFSSHIGIWAALGSTASWALCAVLFKKLGERLDPIGMTMVKALLSVLFLLPFIIILYGNLLLPWKDLALLAVSGCIGIALGDSFFFASLGRLSPLALAILLLAGPDVFAGVLGLVCLGEMPSWQVWSGIILIMVGMGGLLFPLPADQDGCSSKTTIYGLVFGVLALICTAASMVIIKPVLVRIPSMEATMFRMFFGGVLLLGYGILTGKLKAWSQPFRTGDYRWGFAGTVAIVTFGGFWLSLAAVKFLDLVVASALMSLEPLFVLPFMIIFGKHKPTLKEIFCMFSAVAGVLVIVFFNTSKNI